MLITGNAQLKQLQTPVYQGADPKAYQRVLAALQDYSGLVDSKTDRYISQDPGALFYERMTDVTEELEAAITAFLKHSTVKHLDTSWLRDLVSMHIPATMGWAARLRTGLAAYKDAKWTFLTAMDDIRTGQLQGYLAKEPSWNSLSEVEQNHLMALQSDDARIVAHIRGRSTEMIKAGEEPRQILQFIAHEVTNFVKGVIKDATYATGMSADPEPLAVLSTGAFGGGELFPYSDVDIQLLTTKVGNDQDKLARMEGLLNHIRQRIRLATMNEEGGRFVSTKAWDIDQLVPGTYDPESSATGDLYKGLAYTNVLYAKEGGRTRGRAAREEDKGVVADLQDRYSTRLKATAVSLMRDELRQKVKQGDYWLKNTSMLDKGSVSSEDDAKRRLIEFKEKFLRLPKVLLNVLAMYYGLKSQNSWERIDELVANGHVSAGLGKEFKSYLDIVATVRFRYQLFYQHEGLDVVSPAKGVVPSNAALYPKGYYVLTRDDRKALKKAAAIQGSLVELVNHTYDLMQNPPPSSTASAKQPGPVIVLREALVKGFWRIDEGTTIQILAVSQDRNTVQVVIPGVPPFWVDRGALERALGRQIDDDPVY